MPKNHAANVIIVVNEFGFFKLLKIGFPVEKLGVGQ